jgi:DNA-directed RNA polymerase specialized sigma24 family protein
MRKDDIQLCEGRLRDFRDIQKSLRIRELELLSRLPHELIDGGEKLPEQQRFVEDREYSELSSIVNIVTRAVSKLPSHLQRAVVLTYVDGMSREVTSVRMHCSEPTTRRWCLKAIEQLYGQLSRVYHKVGKWRRREEEEKEKLIGE